MAYQVVSIGKVFTDKTRQRLAEKLTAYEQQGWEFHSVFAVSERSGCLGLSTEETLYMVLKGKS